MSLFGRKKSLDKIKLSELTMEKAGLEADIKMQKKELAVTDRKINDALIKNKSAQSEYEIETLARDAADLIDTKRGQRDKLDKLNMKLKAINKLIEIKEENDSSPAKHKDVLDELDIDKLLKNEERKSEDAEIKNLRAERILQTEERKEDYEKVLSIFKAVNLDDESIDVARTEMEDLTSNPVISTGNGET